MFLFLAITQAGCRRSFPRHLLHRITTLAISAVVVLVAQVINTQPVNADQAADQAARPNIVLIMTDDMGWQDLACQGNPVLRSPRVDALARQGVRFTNAYAAAPVCSPTRAALMTGLAPARLQITQHGADTQRFWPKDRKVQPPPTRHELPLDTHSLAERLKARGYATGFFGKWHLGGEAFYPTHHGFDVNVGGCAYGGPPTYFDPYRIPTLPPRKSGEYLTDRLADETIAFLRREHDQPMFVCLWTYNPHYPFEAPEELVKHYQGKEGRGLKNPIYGGQIEATDRAVGRVLDELQRLEIDDQTLVIFTSDNGGWSGATDNTPLRAGKGYLYEGGLRVPLIVRWPGVTQSGREEDSPVVSMDLTATILDAAGVKLKAEDALDGETLRPLFGGGNLERKALFFHYPHFAFHRANRPGSAVREGDYKLLHFYDDDTVELYDVAQDLSETTDLAQKKPQVAARLKQRLTAWLQETEAGIPQRRQP